eukprot:TRINITY_DN504_c0_g1_i3.p1 TRINITY_DN504_c0_g1~~TRINITY_DN504_c0_g1_i3.p1  ORF type:complete len:487 (+),score=97.88 TRINITY_DN504_c0_g1_i3:36-1496(+)
MSEKKSEKEQGSKPPPQGSSKKGDKPKKPTLSRQERVARAKAKQLQNQGGSQQQQGGGGGGSTKQNQQQGGGSGGSSTTKQTQQQQGQQHQGGGAAKQPQRGGPASKQGQEGSVPVLAQFDDPSKRKKVHKKQILPLQLSKKQVQLFSHLPQYEGGASVGITIESKHLHPDIVKLGILYHNRIIQGSHARAAALLMALKTVLMEYEPSLEKTFAVDLDNKLKPIIQYLTDSRPISIGMGNVIKFFKTKIGQTIHMPLAEAKEFLIQEIETFIQERITAADEVIAKHGVSKITDGDVILTYGSSHCVETMIKKAFDMGKKFKVIIVDSRPLFEGKVLLKRLIKHGLDCTYVLLTGLSYMLRSVSKVFLGAHAMLSNGAMVSRVGSAVVAMMAHAFNVPVIVVTQTYKFTERVQLDSICFNELDDPDKLVTSFTLKGYKELPNLKIVNMIYDVTPIENVTLVITEVGMIPPTSVPVVLREYRADITRI